MSAIKWIPPDDELDGLARSLASPDPSVRRAEQNRTRVLAMAGSTAQRSRRLRAPAIAVFGALAVAAVVILWLVRPRGDEQPAVVREDPPPQHELLISALGPSRFEKVRDWPEYELRVREGRLSVQVAGRSSTERFRITTSDAVLEVQSSRFIVEVRHDRLTDILVERGRVELRVDGGAAIILEAGGRWTRPKTAVAPSVTQPDPPPVVASAPKSKTRTIERSPRATPTIEQATKPGPAESDATPTVTKPAPQQPPGEAEFRRGWAALRGGDAATAASSFQAACRDLASNALAEDACYWSGVAAKRAGQLVAARDAFTRFIARFPSSIRAGEASALLGWLLYDAGDLDGAVRRFKAAANDRTVSVRESATRGLVAIERKRAGR